MTDAHPYAENGELEKNTDTHPHEARKVPSWFPPGEEDGEARQPITTETVAMTLAEQRGLTKLHPFDDEFVVAGQASCGIEILRQAAERDCYVLAASWPPATEARLRSSESNSAARSFSRTGLAR